MTDEQRRVVVADACVLINLIHVCRLDLCGQLQAFEFVIPDHVQDEITHPEQRDALDNAVSAGVFRFVSITDPEDIDLFSELTLHLGRGEAACLVLAARNGWSVASDEKGRFRSEALVRIGEERLLGTIEIYTTALRAGLLTIEQADADKAILDERRFRMPFESFREFLPDAEVGEAGP